MERDVRLYVLTRTAARPRMFARLRQSLRSQTFDGDVRHVVHAEADNTRYVRGDIIVIGPRLRRGTAPWERYQARLLDRLVGEPPGWVTFLDDDDEYMHPEALTRIASYCKRRSDLPVWKTLRENGRISPAVFPGDLGSPEGRICWESAAFHTSHLDLARGLVGADDGSDGRFWAALAEHLTVRWHDDVLTRPQRDGRAGKGHGRRQDA
jgi:hypothetical protein